MRNLIKLILVGVLMMSLMNVTELNKDTEDNSSVLLGMILLKNNEEISIDKILKNVKSTWNLQVDSLVSDSGVVSFMVDEYQIAMVKMPIAIPGDEIKETAGYNYFWENGVEESQDYKSHIILTIPNAGNDPMAENVLFNKIAYSVLKETKSIGIYIGQRSLLLKKEFYLSNSEMLKEGALPLYNWIYFGMRSENKKNSIYSYGLYEFGKKEIEMINSKESFESLHEIMFDILSYVLGADIELKDGETIGMSAEQKLKITVSKGVYLEEETIKIKY